MLKNYFRIAARILARNKLYTFINVIGLALGVCVCIIIWLVLSFDLNFDRFHPDGDRIYSVGVGGKPGERRPAGVLPPMPAAMQADIPGLESITAYFTYDESLTVRVPVQGHVTMVFQPRLPGQDRQTGIIIADSGWFHVFFYQWLAGNQATALTQPYQVVITESAAKRYFGDIEPIAAIGRELIYADSLHVHISGVVRDWAQHSDLAYTDIISFPTIKVSFLKETHQMDDWRMWKDAQHPWPYAYVKLASGVNSGQVDAQMNRITAKRDLRTPDGRYTQMLQPISDLHFNADYADGRRKAHRPTLYALAGIALFILVLAAVNFINLATAQSLERAKEVGVRKVLGSDKGRLIRQFLLETGVQVALALLLAVLMVWPVMHYFENYIPIGVHFNPFTLANLLFLAGLLITLTLASGFYPAQVLARYKPAETLKGSSSIKGGEKWWVRRSLVVFQFTISLVFVIVTLVIGNQIGYMLNTDYGFRSDAIVTVMGQQSKMDTSMRNIKILEQRYSHLPGIAEVIREDMPPIGWERRSTLLTYKGKQLVTLMMNMDGADHRFIPFYGMRMVAGRNFIHIDSVDEFVINETAAKQFGFATPSAALGQFLYAGDQAVPIVGVVADYHERPFQETILPIVIDHDPRWESNLGIRLASTGKGVNNVKSTLEEMEKIYKQIYPGAHFSYDFMDDFIRNLYQNEQKTAWLVNVAMGLAIFISCMGLFGLSLFTAERRAGEIGIRKVLGATTANIAVMLNRQYIRLVLLALVIASPLAWIVAHQWLQNFAYRVTVDVWVFVIAGVSAIGLALLTVSYQSIRAALANPVRSLKVE
jgi:putative ABC transport system permease protein